MDVSGLVNRVVRVHPNAPGRYDAVVLGGHDEMLYVARLGETKITPVNIAWCELTSPATP